MRTKILHLITNDNSMSLSATSKKVLKFVKDKKGKKVGTGECWDLAEFALKQAGANTSNDLGTVTADADYIWGKKITAGQAQPGDIIQYRNFSFTKKVTKPDGSWSEMTGGYSHHTAIITQVGTHGYIKVLEQNVKKKGLLRRYVVPNDIYLKSVSFRQNNGTQIAIQVTGKFWVYRPIKKPKPRIRR